MNIRDIFERLGAARPSSPLLAKYYGQDYNAPGYTSQDFWGSDDPAMKPYQFNWTPAPAADPDRFANSGFVPPQMPSQPSQPSPTSLDPYGDANEGDPNTENNPEDLPGTPANFGALAASLGLMGSPLGLAAVAAKGTLDPSRSFAEMFHTGFLNDVVDSIFGTNFGLDEHGEGFGSGSVSDVGQGGPGGPGGTGSADEDDTMGGDGGISDSGQGGPGGPGGTGSADEGDTMGGSDDDDDDDGGDEGAGDWFKGGYVARGMLSGPNPPGPDDGRGNLDEGEYVIRADAVKHYGTDFFERLNERKILKKSARGLL